MTIPNLVTGAMSADSKLVQSGKQRGMKYEIWYDPSPGTARRMSSSGNSLRAHGSRGTGRHYSAVVYSRYGENLEFSEPEQIGVGRTPEDGVRIASDYIERVWRQEMDMPSRRRPRRPGHAMENPMTHGGKTALVIGGVAAILATVGVLYANRASAKTPPSIKTITLQDNNAVVSLDVGQSLVVSLPSTDPKTGYTWALDGTAIPDDPNNPIITAADAGAPKVNGAITTFTINALSKGTVQVIVGTMSPGGGSTVRLTFTINIAGGATGLTKNA